MLDRQMLFELISCVKREVSLRYRVYPKRVAAGYMTQEQAKKEQDLMYKVQVLLQAVYNNEAPEPVQQSFLKAQDYVQNKWHGG